MGVTRFLDEALERGPPRPPTRPWSCAAAPTVPPTRRGPPCWTALEPVLVDAPAGRAGGPAPPRRRPDPARAAGARGARGGHRRARAPAPSRTRSAASRGRSRRCCAGWAASRPSGRSCWCSRTSTSPTPRPAPSRRSSPGSPATERIALVLSYQPDRLTREHPLRENLAVIEARASGRRSAWTSRRFARREIAGAHRGHRGRAAVGVDRRPGRGAVRRARRWSSRSWSPPAASCATRPSPGPSRTSSRRAWRAARRSAAASCGCSPRPSGPMTVAELAVAAAAFEAGVGRPASRRGRPRCRDAAPSCWTRTSPPASRRRSSTGSCGATPDDRLAIRHELVARAVVADLLPSQRPRYRAALAQRLRRTRRSSPPRTGAAPTASTRRARRPSRPGGSRCACEAPAGRARRPRARPATCRPPARRPATEPAPDTPPQRRRRASWPSWPPRPPTPRCARRGPSPTRRARSPRSASGGTASRTPSSRLVSAGTAWPRATPRAPRPRSGGPRTWRRPSRPWSGPGSSRCSPRSG